MLQDLSKAAVLRFVAFLQELVTEISAEGGTILGLMDWEPGS